MIDYTVIDAYGNPRRYGQCEAALLAQQAVVGQSVVEGLPPSDTHLWDGQQWTERPAWPGIGFQWQAGEWVQTRTLEAAKDEAWTRIKASRQEAFDAPLVTAYGTFDSDDDARRNISDAAQLASTLLALGQSTNIDFTRADNTTATLTLAQMIEVGLGLGAKVQAAYATGRARRTAIDAATTIAEADAVVW